MRLVGKRAGPDKLGNSRRVIVFHLVPERDASLMMQQRERAQCHDQLSVRVGAAKKARCDELPRFEDWALEMVTLRQAVYRTRMIRTTPIKK